MRGLIKCPKCGDKALYDTDQKDLAIHTFVKGPWIIPTDYCSLGFFARIKARKLLTKG